MVRPNLAALSKAMISLPGMVLISPVNGSVNERTRPEGLRILSSASRGAAPNFVRLSTKRLTCSGFGQNCVSCGISVCTYCSTIMRQPHYRPVLSIVDKSPLHSKPLNERYRLFSPAAHFPVLLCELRTTMMQQEG